MNISLDLPSARHFVRAYQPGSLVLNDQTYTHSVLLSAEGIIPWAPRHFAELSLEHIQQIAVQPVELVILGTGAHQAFPDQALLQPLYQARIGVETMSTQAACRTYNLLVSEGRKVMAALLIN